MIVNNLIGKEKSQILGMVIIIIQSTLSIVTPLGTKKNNVIIKILYDVTKERFFLISLLVTWTNANVLIGRDVTISGVTVEGDDCMCILDLSKLCMYQFYYNTLKAKYGG